MPSQISFPDRVADRLAKMEIDADETNQRTNDHWIRPRSLQKPAAEFVYLLTKAVQAKKVLEVGTSVGFSTVHFALALAETDGHLTTLELMPAKFELAKENLRAAGLTDTVTQHLGDALAILPTLSGPWDLVFIDLEKELYLPVWELIKDEVKPGGVIVADNVLSHAESLASYIEAIRAHPEFQSVTIPIGHGLELSYRRG